jgi:hypothetical protein
LETIVRDRRNGKPGMLFVSAADLDDYVHVPVTMTRPVNVIDLRGGQAVALGVPTNTIRASPHRPGQSASLAAYLRADSPDGLWYPSRLNGDEILLSMTAPLARLPLAGGGNSARAGNWRASSMTIA